MRLQLAHGASEARPLHGSCGGCCLIAVFTSAGAPACPSNCSRANHVSIKGALTEGTVIRPGSPPTIALPNGGHCGGHPTVCSGSVLWSLGQTGAGPPRDGSVVSCQLLDCIRKSDPQLSDDDLLTLTRWRGGRFKLSSAAVATSRKDRTQKPPGRLLTHFNAAGNFGAMSCAIIPFPRLAAVAIGQPDRDPELPSDPLGAQAGGAQPRFGSTARPPYGWSHARSAN